MTKYPTNSEYGILSDGQEGILSDGQEHQKMVNKLLCIPNYASIAFVNLIL